MPIAPEGQDLDEMKPLRVKIPLRLHIKLHTLRLLTGKNMSHTVQVALERYLDDIMETEITIEEKAGSDEGPDDDEAAEEDEEAEGERDREEADDADEAGDEPDVDEDVDGEEAEAEAGTG